MSKTNNRLLSTPRSTAALALSAAAIAVLAGCSSGATSDSGTLTVQGDVAIVYAMRSAYMNQNPTDATPSADGGDLMIQEKSSPSALAHNMTAQFTKGKGDVASPNVSYDGKKVVFAMRCPADAAGFCTGAMNIYEYDMTGTTLTAGSFRRVTTSQGATDTDPYYLPGGKGFVFVSNEQPKSKINQDGLGHSYSAQDEYERSGVTNVMTVAADGSNRQQITFNQSHDRSPTVTPEGDIMFSHWDHVGGRNHFKVFTVKPDGTNLFVKYGAHSEGNSFLHPRAMDPNGKYKGFLVSDLMPLSRTHEGGGVVLIDAANYSEQNTPANAGVPATGGQVQATLQPLAINGGLSRYGRVTTPAPLHSPDGKGTDNRILISYAPCEVMKKESKDDTSGGTRTSCTQLTEAELARIGDSNRLIEEEADDLLQNKAYPQYAVYMFDPDKQTFLIVAAPPTGFMYTHPVAIQPHLEPNTPEATPVDATLAAQNIGILEVRSVFDTDNLGRMGEGMLVASDLPAGCTAAIAKTSPTDPLDTRGQVADIAKLKDPTSSSYGCFPGKMIRAVRAIAPAAGMSGMRSAIGLTEFEPQRLLGYAPIEPDGSFKLKVPADTPIGLCVVDPSGACLQTHTNWIQVRPGERRTCDGCHSPRRGGALNSGAVANTQSSAIVSSLASAHASGETQADTRTRLDPTALMLGANMSYTDIWADTTKAGIKARSAVALNYTGNATPGDDLTTAVPVNGMIDYPDHVAPLWTKNRGANTCTNCHNNPDKLDLSNTLGGDGFITSYVELMEGDPVIDEKTGLPQTEIKEGVLVIKRGPALVSTMASEGDAAGLARQSRLFEILTGKSLLSSAGDRSVHPNPPTTAPDHSKMLNRAEIRLVAEWIDLGGKYYNNLFNANSGVKMVTGLNMATFTKDVLPIISKTCAAYCHQAIGSDDPKLPAVGTSFRTNRYVLTGDPEGDYGVTLSMITNACSPASNLLLKRPSTVPHPYGAVGAMGQKLVLPVGSADYNTISKWIASGCS